MNAVEAVNTRHPLDFKQKWFVAQHWTQQKSHLSRAGLAVLMRLLDRQNPRTGRCDPSAKGLAEETGYSERSVRNAFSELEARGAIKRFRAALRARNQFLIFSVEELGQHALLAELKPRSGRRSGRNPVSAPPAARFRTSVKRTSPETRKETRKKKELAGKAIEPEPMPGAMNQGPSSNEMDPGQFEQRVARVFEKQGYGYVGLMSLPAEDLEGAYALMATGDLTFSDAVGQLLEKYRSLRDQA